MNKCSVYHMTKIQSVEDYYSDVQIEIPFEEISCSNRILLKKFPIEEDWTSKTNRISDHILLAHYTYSSI